MPLNESPKSFPLAVGHYKTSFLDIRTRNDIKTKTDRDPSLSFACESILDARSRLMVFSTCLTH